MRYRNWDILLFPGNSNTPIEEFQTSCSIVSDPDIAAHHGLGQVDHMVSALMPMMTTFIPSQPAGTPFRLSVHSWGPPDSSARGQNSTGAPAWPMFEVLLRVNGKFTTARIFIGNGSGPITLDKPFETTLSPDECPLTFPEFDFNVWEKSISLNITGPGRISAYIAEIFGRDGRYDRGPNIVGFSFRYAPLGQYIRPAVVAPSPTRSLAAWLTPQAELLESMGIAWPPPPLWPQMSSLPVNTEITSGSMELTGEPISFPLHQVQAPTAFWPGLDVIPPSSILPDPSNVHVGPWPLGSFPDLSTASFDNGAPPPAMPLQVPDPFVENVGAEGPMMPYVPDVGGNNVGFMEAVATASLDQPDTPASVHNPINDNFPSHPCDFRLFLEPFVWEGDMPLDGLERKAGPECFDTLGPSACHYGDVGSWGGSVLQDIPPPKPSLGGSDEARTYGTDMQMRASAPQSEPVPVSGKRIHRRKAADANRGGATKRGGSIKLEPGSRIGRRALADGTGSPTITGRKRARPHDLAPDKLLQQRRKRGRPTAVSPTNKGDAASLDASQAVDSKRVLASPPIKNEPKDDILTGIRPTATV